MKRYALYFSGAFLAGVACVLFAPRAFALLTRHWGLALAAGAILSVLSLRRRWFALLAVLLGIAIGAGYTGIYSARLVRPLTALDGRTHTVTAVVRAYPDVYEDSQRVELLVDAAESGIPYPFWRFRTIGYLPLTEQPLTPGDTIRAQMSFYVPTVRQGFDRQRYQMGNGNFISCSYVRAEDETRSPVLFEVTHRETLPLRYQPLHWARQWGERVMTELPAREGGFLRAMLLGDKQSLDPVDEQNLKKVGLSHIIAVSGMHLMFLVGLSSQLFSRRIGVPLSIGIVLLFIPMAGCSPSILRAGIMTLLSCAAFLFDEIADSETSLGLALLLLLLWNPYALYSLSLQLSFLSTFGILRFARPVETAVFGWLYQRLPGKRTRSLARLFGATFSCSACAVLMTAPVLVTAFGYLTILSIPANLLTFSVVGLVFELGVFLCLLPFLRVLLAPVLTVLIRYILGCAAVLSRLHWGVLYWEEPAGKIAVLALSMLIVVLVLSKWSKPKFTVPVLCMILTASVWTAYADRRDTTFITLHAVGEGQMITVADGYDTLSLIDCGSSARQDSLRLLQEYMNWNGFDRLDTVIFTAVDKAHARAAGELLRTVPVGHVILPNHVKESDTLTELQSAAQEQMIPLTVWTQDGEAPVTLPGVTASLIGGVDRKLGVRLNGSETDLLILHSMTQKMLDGLLDQTPLRADSVVLPNQFEKEDLFARAMEEIEPQTIYISSGYETATRLLGIPVRNTAGSGDLVIKIKHN